VETVGRLDGYSGAIVDKALTEAADQLPPLPDGSRGTSSWRKATASPHSASPRIRPQPRSPCSSTPNMR
jgi:hypothetical protein